MMMHDIAGLVLAGVTGALLGALFFGSLWWTVQKGLSSKHPALWFFGSLLLRTGIALAGFYFMAHGNWQRLLACLLGFIIARLLVIRFARPAERTTEVIQEAGHAS